MYALLAGCFGLAIGSYAVLENVRRGLMGGPGGLVEGFSLIAGLFCLGFGIALIILAQRDSGKPFMLRRDGVVAGVAGVFGTFVLSVIASWGTHEERHHIARSTIQYYASELKLELQSSVALIDRLANRWASLGFEVPEALEQTETRWYFKDTPALKFLMLFRDGRSPVWRRSRNPEDLLWVMDQTVNPEVLGWVRKARDERLASAWIFPDPAKPFSAIALVRPDLGSGAYFLAVFDVAELLALESSRDYYDFEIRLEGADSPAVERAIALHHLEHEVYEHVPVNIPNGPDLVLSATAGPASVLSLRGMLPPALFGFGLLMSYMLIMGRSLLGLQKGQAREINVAEQRFRSLFSQSPDAVFAFDREGVYQAVNPVAQKIVGFTNRDLGVTRYQDVLTQGAMDEADFVVFDTAFQNTVAGHPQTVEVAFLNAQGKRRNYECAFVPIVVDAGVVGVFALVKDVTDRHQAQENQRILQRSLESSENAVVVVDVRESHMPVVFVNSAFTAITGYSREEVIGAPVKQLTGPEKLIQRADMAMYKAKQQGRDTYVVYSEDLDSKLSKRVALRNELQEAIKTGQLFLNYQPQVDQDGHLCGLEALVRWKHPEKGFISPADFIPVAEETGQIAHLGKWVTTQACKDARRLLEMGLLKGRMAVNLSPLQFHRPGFLTVLRSILEDTGLAPEHLELELTEGILMKDSEGAIDILNVLNGMGVATAIDDFGTGFSSFSYLKDLPVDNIKIDRSFVDNVTTNEKDAAVCKGVITLAREMGLNVVAEGVETQEQFCYLKSHGCESFQGYYFARPMLFEDLVQWIGKTG